MTDHTEDCQEVSRAAADEEEVRSLLDHLLADSRLYKNSKDYKDLLGFVARLRDFAPFNAMLLQIQKPGLSYAASTRDWLTRFGRRPKVGARPLLILWPFGPVALVYDVMDTEGRELPKDVACFVARGPIDAGKLASFQALLERKRIRVYWVDVGDGNAGLIRVIRPPSDDKRGDMYAVHINRNHNPAVQFATLTHELGHLYLGHLGEDPRLKIPVRGRLTHAQKEIEAESVAYILCERNGVKCKSQTYLSNYVDWDPATYKVDVYQVMRAAGQVETVLGIAIRGQFDRPKRRRPRQR